MTISKNKKKKKKMDDEIKQHISFLLEFQNNTNKKRNDAESYLMEMFNTNKPKMLELSCKITLLDEAPTQAVHLSYAMLHRCKEFILSNWNNFGLEQRDIMLNVARRGLAYDDLMVKTFASTLFTYIIKANSNLGITDDILGYIVGPIIDETFPFHSKVGSIMAMRELINYNVISKNTPKYRECFPVFLQFLLSILQYYQNLKNDLIPLIECYYAIFPFYGEYFNNFQIKSQILAFLRDISKTSDRQLLDTLFHFLSILIEVCYNTIAENMKEIFDIATQSFQKITDDIEMIIPFLFFCEYISNLECKLINKKSQDNKLGIPNDTVIQNIASQMAPNLIKPLVQVMIISAKDEPLDETSGDIDIPREIASCLQIFGKLSPSVYNFVTTHFHEMSKDENWRVRYASVILLWCITSSPNRWDQINFFKGIMEQIAQMINDFAFIIKDASLWILDIIFNTYLEIGTDSRFIELIMNIISQAVHAPAALCIRICTLALSFGNLYRNISNQSSDFSKIFQQLIYSLLNTFDRSDAVETQLSYYCTEAIAAAIRAAPDDYENIVVEILNKTVQRIQDEIKSFNSNVSTVYLQTRVKHFCVFIWAIAKRLAGKLKPYSDNVSLTIINILLLKSSICHEDGLIALSALITALDEKMSPYIPQIIQIFKLSQESGSKEIIETSASVILSLFRSLGKFMTNTTVNQEIVQIFLYQLMDQNLDISAKTEILLAFSQMIEVLKSDIEPAYDNFVGQLSLFQSNIDQYDSSVYPLLFEALLKGYSSLIISSVDRDYINVIIKNYKQITALFMKMSTYNVSNFPLFLKRMILDYLETVLDTIAARVNIHINKKCVTSIVDRICLDNDQKLAFRAKIILKRIKNS